MKSLYGRQFLLTAGMILISFAMLGVSFFVLSYRYTLQETRQSIERNTDDVARFTANVRAEGVGVRSVAYQLYIANVAHISNAFVLITEADGEMVLCSDGVTVTSGLSGQYIPQDIAEQVVQQGDYKGMTTLGGLFPEKRFVAGTPITITTQNIITARPSRPWPGWPIWPRRCPT